MNPCGACSFWVTNKGVREMNKRADIIRVAEFIWREFSISTFEPKRLGQFARDFLKSGKALTAYDTFYTRDLRESLERVSHW